AQTQNSNNKKKETVLTPSRSRFGLSDSCVNGLAYLFIFLVIFNEKKSENKKNNKKKYIVDDKASTP
ncbi:hypothetical protein ABTD92_21625, partial [Acinetobacter baumannii]